MGTRRPRCADAAAAAYSVSDHSIYEQQHHPGGSGATPTTPPPLHQASPAPLVTPPPPPPSSERSTSPRTLRPLSHPVAFESPETARRLSPPALPPSSSPPPNASRTSPGGPVSPKSPVGSTGPSIKSLCAALSAASEEKGILDALSGIQSRMRRAAAPSSSEARSWGRHKLPGLLADKLVSRGRSHSVAICAEVASTLVSLSGYDSPALLQAFYTPVLEGLREASSASLPCASTVSIVFSLLCAHLGPPQRQPNSSTQTAFPDGASAAAPRERLLHALREAKPLSVLLQLYRRQLMQVREEEQENLHRMQVHGGSLVRRLRQSRSSSSMDRGVVDAGLPLDPLEGGGGGDGYPCKFASLPLPPALDTAASSQDAASPSRSPGKERSLSPCSSTLSSNAQPADRPARSMVAVPAAGGRTLGIPRLGMSGDNRPPTSPGQGAAGAFPKAGSSVSLTARRSFRSVRAGAGGARSGGGGGGSVGGGDGEAADLTKADSMLMHSSSMMRLISHSSNLCLKRNSFHKLSRPSSRQSPNASPSSPAIRLETSVNMPAPEPPQEDTSEMYRTTLLHLAHKMGQIYATKDAPALLKRMRKLGVQRRGGPSAAAQRGNFAAVEPAEMDATHYDRQAVQLAHDGYRAAIREDAGEAGGAAAGTLVDVVRLVTLKLIDLAVGSDAASAAQCVELSLHELDTYFFSQTSTAPQNVRLSISAGASLRPEDADPTRLFTLSPKHRNRVGAADAGVARPGDMLSHSFPPASPLRGTQGSPLADTVRQAGPPRRTSDAAPPTGFKTSLAKSVAFLFQSIVNRSGALLLAPSPKQGERDVLADHSDPFLFRWSQVVKSVLYRGGGGAGTAQKLSVLAKYMVLLNRYVAAGPREGLLRAYSAEVVMEVVMDVVQESQGIDSFLLVNIQLMLQCVRYVTLLLCSTNKPPALASFLAHLLTREVSFLPWVIQQSKLALAALRFLRPAANPQQDACAATQPMLSPSAFAVVSDDDSDDENGETQNPFACHSACISEGQPLYAAGLIMDFWCAAAEFVSLNCGAAAGAATRDAPAADQPQRQGSAPPAPDAGGAEQVGRKQAALPAVIKKISPSSASSSSNSLSTSSAEGADTAGRKVPKMQVPPLQHPEEADTQKQCDPPPQPVEGDVDSASFLEKLDFLLSPFEGLVLTWLVSGEVFEHADLKAKFLHFILATLALPDSPLLCPLALSTFTRVHYLSVVQMYYHTGLHDRPSNATLCILHLKCVAFFSTLGGSVSQTLLDKLGIAGLLSEELSIEGPATPRSLRQLSKSTKSSRTGESGSSGLRARDERDALLAELQKGLRTLDSAESSFAGSDASDGSDAPEGAGSTPPLAYLSLGNSPEEDDLLETVVTVHSFTLPCGDPPAGEVMRPSHPEPPSDTGTPVGAGTPAVSPGAACGAPAAQLMSPPALFRQTRLAEAEAESPAVAPKIGGTPAAPKPLKEAVMQTAGSEPDMAALRKQNPPTPLAQPQPAAVPAAAKPLGGKPMIPSLRLGKAQPALYGVADAPIGHILQPSPQPSSPLPGVSVVASVMEPSPLAPVALQQLPQHRAAGPPLVPMLKFNDRTPSAHWGTREPSAAGVLRSAASATLTCETRYSPRSSPNLSSMTDSPREVTMALMVLPPSTNDMGGDVPPKLGEAQPPAPAGQPAQPAAERPLHKNPTLHAWVVTTMLLMMVDGSHSASLNAQMLAKASALTEHCRILFHHLNNERHDDVCWQVLRILRRLPESLHEPEAGEAPKGGDAPCRKQHSAEYYVSHMLQDAAGKAAILLKLMAKGLFSSDQLRTSAQPPNPMSSPASTSSLIGVPERGRHLGVGAFGSVVKCRIGAAIDCAGMPTARTRGLQGDPDRGATEYALKQVPASADRILDVFSEVLVMHRLERAEAMRERDRCLEKVDTALSSPGVRRSSLENCSGVEAVRLVDYGCDGTSFCLLMPCYSQSLKQWRTGMADRGTSPDTSMLLELFFRVLACVHAVHSEGVVHYDLKCDNVLLKWTPGVPFPSVALCDFGESIFETETQRVRMRARGTECIRPPEMLLAHKGKDFDRRSHGNGSMASVDVWALGCLLFELFTGDFLFSTDDFACFFHRLTAPSADLLTDSDIAKLRMASKPLSQSPGRSMADFLVDYIKLHLNRDPKQRPPVDTLLQYGLEHSSGVCDDGALSFSEALDHTHSSFMVLSSAGSNHALRSAPLTSLPSLRCLSKKGSEAGLSCLSAQLNPPQAAGDDNVVRALFDRLLISGSTSVDADLLAKLSDENVGLVINLGEVCSEGATAFAGLHSMEVHNVFASDGSPLPSPQHGAKSPQKRRSNRNIFPGDTQSTFAQPIATTPKSQQIPSQLQKQALRYGAAVSRSLQWLVQECMAKEASRAESSARFGGAVDVLRSACIVGGYEKGLTFYAALLSAVYGIPAYDVLHRVVHSNSLQLGESDIVRAAQSLLSSVVECSTRIVKALCLESRDASPAPPSYLRCLCGESYYSHHAPQSPSSPGPLSFNSLPQPCFPEEGVSRWFSLLGDANRCIYGPLFPDLTYTRVAGPLFIHGNTALSTVKFTKGEGPSPSTAESPLAAAVQLVAARFPEVAFDEGEREGRQAISVHACSNCFYVTHVVVKLADAGCAPGSGGGSFSKRPTAVFVCTTLQTGVMSLLSRAGCGSVGDPSSLLASPVSTGPVLSPIFARNSSFPSVGSATPSQARVPVPDLRPKLFSLL